jgi:hypothetical protein
MTGSVTFDNYWSHNGHTFGDCFTSDTIPFVYVPIPRNASTWTKNRLVVNGWQPLNFHRQFLTHKNSFVVLRHPLKRWVSGCVEYFLRLSKKQNADVDVTQFNSEFVNLIMDQIVLDEHTEKQVHFIAGLNRNNTTFFMMDQNYPSNLTHYARNQGLDVDFTNNPPDHKTDLTNQLSAQLTDFFENIVEISKYRHKILEFYVEDMRLYDGVNYYNYS